MPDGFIPQGDEFQVNTETFDTQHTPSITSLVDGGFVVTWASFGQDGASNGIYGQRYSADGATVGVEFQVNTYTTNDQANPSIAALTDGGFVVTWMSFGQDGSGYGIYAQRYGADGATVEAEFQVNTETTNSQLSPTVTALADGGFVVIWESDIQDGSGYGVYGQRYGADGTTVGAEFQVNTETTNNQQVSTVTALADGGFVAIWGSSGQDGSGYGVYGQRYGADGTTVGAEFRVNTETANDQWYSAITALTDGGFVVTWSSSGQDGDSYGIYGQRYGADGATVGDEFLINTETTDFQGNSSITALADGGFVVTWDSFNQDGDGLGVYGQRYDADGATVGDEFLINTETSDYQQTPSITALADGGFVVTWRSSGQDGSSSGIYAQQFAAQLFGTAGDNEISDTVGANWINGQAGDDILNGLQGDDTLFGGTGNDTLNGGDGVDELHGGDGDDNLSIGLGGAGQIADGGEGSDTIEFSFSVEAWDISLSDGTASLDGTNIVDMTSIENVVGGVGDDTITGDNGVNILSGGAGDDILNGLEGADTIIGGKGQDIVNGGSDSDTLNGGKGKDTLIGSKGKDVLNGGKAGDTLKGGKGDDILDGGTGKDKLYGGKGEDVFVFAAGDGKDTIFDFKNGKDKLDLTAFEFENKAEAKSHFFERGSANNDVVGFDFDGTNIKIIGLDLGDINNADIII